MNKRKPLILIALAMVVTSLLFAVSCGGSDDNGAKKYTMSFETFGGTEVQSVSAVGGSMIFAPAAPQKSGYTFLGWYADDKFTGDPIELPDTMPKKNVKYYARFVPVETEYTVTYVYNLGQVPYDGDIESVTVKAGEKVTVADGADFNAAGYMFMGWADTQSGTVSLTEKLNGQYNAGEEITPTDNIRLYAQWARGHEPRVGEGTIYVYYPLVKKGRGAAVLVREDKDDLLGFVASDENYGYTGYTFDFYSDEFEDGQYSGRIYSDGTYAITDGEQGQFVYYDYVYDEPLTTHILAIDGFGFATWTEIRGDMIVVRGSGSYEYDDEFDSFLFEYISDTDEADADSSYAYFVTDRTEIESTKFDGYFYFMGMERGPFVAYGNGEINAAYRLDLDGYGNAVLNVYDLVNETVTDKYTGKYKGTDSYESFYGEWRFIPDSKTVNGFEFIVTGIMDGNSVVPVFIMFDEATYGEYTEQDGESTLYLDGYGSALFTVDGVDYVGEFTVDDDGLLMFVPYVEDEEGDFAAVGKTYISLNKSTKTFTVNRDGYIVSGGTLSAYLGTSAFAVIPDSVTTVADDAFNYSNDDAAVSLISVTIPVSVTTIGERAFENNHTLRRAVFLSETPIAIDFSNGKDPFRWPAGDFIIVVPEGSQDAYKAAWTDCKYDIKGSVEVNTLPEFEIVEGVLVRYNKPADSEDMLDIIIPEDVVEIADGVFRGFDFIASVDLKNVVTIGDQAFSGCKNLVTVKMPNVQNVGAMAFAACVKLKSGETEGVVALPAVVTVGEAAFSGCESLAMLQLGADLKSIGDLAFYECNIYEKSAPLFVELLGSKAPTMGSKVTNGNISFRFKVQSIDVALKCFAAEDWAAYNRHLYIESGEERGMYISGSTTLELNGRAVFMSSYTFMYAVDGETITMYEYDSYSQSYDSMKGTYKDGVITIKISGTVYKFKRITDSMTYTTADGKYTLVCNPNDLLPENYPDYRGYADVTFNGKPVQMLINGYSVKVIYKYTDTDGKEYDFRISFDGDELIVQKTLSERRISDITAEDGSKITLLFTGDIIYVETAEFKIEVAENTNLTWTEVSGVTATQNGNVYTFFFRYRSDRYDIRVVVSADEKTFTYTYTKNA